MAVASAIVRFEWLVLLLAAPFLLFPDAERALALLVATWRRRGGLPFPESFRRALILGLGDGLAAHPDPQATKSQQVTTAKGGGLNLVAGRGETEPLEVADMDLTELVNAKGRRKAHRMPIMVTSVAIIDRANKMMLGWAHGESAVKEPALEA